MAQVCSTIESEEDTLDHGSIVDADGNEVQITEAMIQQACDALARQVPNHHAVAAVRSGS